MEVEVDHPYHEQAIEEATKSILRSASNRPKPRLKSGKRSKHLNSNKNNHSKRKLSQRSRHSLNSAYTR